MPVKFFDIENAFSFVSSGPYGECSAYVNRNTGQTFYHSESGDIDDEIDDEENVNLDEMVEIPHKNDLDLGQELVFDFASAYLPGDYGRVRDIFRRTGAYGRYKDFLESKGLLETWYAFENEREQAALRQWCEENEIELTEEKEGE
jgi:hypothetical protein